MHEKDDIKPQQLVAILEAMKLEINVNVPESMKPGKAIVEKLLVEPGETVKVCIKIVDHLRMWLTMGQAGGRIALIRSLE